MNAQPTSLADISREYIKTLLPKKPHRRWFRTNQVGDNLPEELKELDFALMLFSLKHFELHNFLYDSFIADLSINQIADKYHCSKRTVYRRKQEALETFYLFIPGKYR